MQTLTCSNISKQYEKGKPVLKNVSFTVPATGIFALIGRNGAGKTTLVRILCTQLMPTSGKASINGIDIIGEPERLREIIACVPQEAKAVSWLTAKQFIFTYLLWRGVPYSEAKRKAVAALDKVGLNKYTNVASRKLSGGTRRKVLVATMMASEAPIIFLDEPTTGLDPISRAELWTMLNKLKKDHFIFLTTHYLEEAERLADNIGILEDGKLLTIGTMQDLRKKVKYPYSIKILSDYKPEKPKTGEIIKGIDGYTQVVTTEKEAYSLSRKLIAKHIKFSMNPLSLDDIFYYIVKKPLEEESYDEDDEW